MWNGGVVIKNTLFQHIGKVVKINCGWCSLIPLDDETRSKQFVNGDSFLVLFLASLKVCFIEEDLFTLSINEKWIIITHSSTHIFPFVFHIHHFQVNNVELYYTYIKIWWPRFNRRNDTWIPISYCCNCGSEVLQ